MMKEVITKEELLPMFEEIAKHMEENKEELARLDSLMGDGDLGLTMSKGFGVLPKVVQDNQEEELSKIIMKAGIEMSSVVPSTMGFLMSSGLMHAGRALKAKEEIRSDGYVAFLQGFADGLAMRGKCVVGDRTIYDVMCPSASEAKRCLDENPEMTLSELSSKVTAYAKEQLEHTKELTPKFGKAAIHKEVAKLHVDQGALAGFLVIEAIDHFIQE